MKESKTPLRERLAEKLPEALIEAASVVFALLLALALNQWNENREQAARADAARAAIRAELAENRTEIESARPQLSAIKQKLRDVIDGKSPDAHELSVNLGVSLLSAAAWHAALATQATQTIDFKWMTTVAKVYELQDNYLRVQAAAVDQLTSIPADPKLGGKAIAAALIARIDGLSQLADGLSNAYTDVLGPMPAH
jgi:cell division protein ZapA (FtsZ GTPase activity inhibitor)